jgi:hypothetical protein
MVAVAQQQAALPTLGCAENGCMGSSTQQPQQCWSAGMQCLERVAACRSAEEVRQHLGSLQAVLSEPGVAEGVAHQVLLQVGGGWGRHSDWRTERTGGIADATNAVVTCLHHNLLMHLMVVA